ncbi:MAG: hypothetical protein ACOCUF_01235 [Patescibacteria group bacterium]
MKNKISIFSFIGLFLLISFPALAQQENQESVDNLDSIEEAASFSRVELHSTEMVSQEGGDFEISFNLSNQGDSPAAGINYAVQLISKEEGKPVSPTLNSENSFFGETLDSEENEVEAVETIKDEREYSENISLDKGESMVKNIQYSAPSYLQGDFDLWVVALNKKGELIGLNNAGAITLEASDDYVEIPNTLCYLQVKGKEDQYTINQDVDITQEEELQAICPIKNYFNKEVDLKPVFNIFERNRLGELVKEDIASEKTFTLSPKEEKELTFDIPKLEKPQAYDAEMVLQNLDGEKTSNKVVFHYVIQGESATIQKVQLDKDFYEAGEEAKVEAWITPSASIFHGSRTENQPEIDLTAEIKIKDGQGKLCGNSNDENIEEPQSPLVFNLDITKKC